MRDQNRGEIDQIFEIIDEALDENRVFPAYQPKLCLKSRRVFEIEALARVKSRSGDILTPESFAPALQDPLFAMRLSDRILASALRDLRQVASVSRGLGRCAINVAELQLADPTFVKKLGKAVAAHELTPDAVTIEITERLALAPQRARIADHLQRLSTAGFRLTFDNFGTGYASLSHLIDFDVAQVKIDRSFVIAVNDNPRARAIAATIVELGRQLQLDIVAEGVESPEIERTMRDLGCGFGQGFFFARPMFLDDLLDYLFRVGWTPSA